KPHVVSKECPKGIGSAGAITPDSAFRPAPVIDGMVRLHRSNHVQLGEAIEIFARHVLRVFNAKAAISFAMRLTQFTVEIENDRDCLVANGVRAELQAGGVSLHHPIPHQGHGMHFVRKQPAIVWLIYEPIKKVSSTGTE